MIMKMRNQSHSLFFVICFYFHNRSVLGSTENHPIFWVLVFYSLHSLSERVLKNPITLMRKCFFCLSIYPPGPDSPSRENWKIHFDHLVMIRLMFETIFSRYTFCSCRKARGLLSGESARVFSAFHNSPSAPV